MDATDLRILKQLQDNADIPLVELSRRLGISKTTCWNRFRRMEEAGIITGKHMALDRRALGLPVVAFLSITTGHHTDAWQNRFYEKIAATPEIVEAYRVAGGGADYQLKIVVPDIEAYDALQQKLIKEMEFTSMTTRISLKEIKQTHRLPMNHLA